MSDVIVFNNTGRLITLATRIGSLDLKQGVDNRPRVRLQFVPGLNTVKKKSLELIKTVHKLTMDRYEDSGDLLLNTKEIKRASKQFSHEDQELDKRVEQELRKHKSSSKKAQKIVSDNLAITEAELGTAKEDLGTANGTIAELQESSDGKDAKIAELEAKLADNKA